MDRYSVLPKSSTASVISSSGDLRNRLREMYKYEEKKVSEFSSEDASPSILKVFMRTAVFRRLSASEMRYVVRKIANVES